MAVDKSEVAAPEGLEFFEFIWQQEDACQKLTDDQLPQFGTKATDCFSSLGTALSLLDRVSSCWWNCPGGKYKEHTIQYIAGRGCNLARAAVRLTRFGFYDEALGLVRSMGEIANLLILFDADEKVLQEWRDADSDTRWIKFRPKKVQRRLGGLGKICPMGETKYSLLCEMTTHPIPDLRPEAYNEHGLVVAGAHFQPIAMVMLTNEIAALVAVIVLYAAILAKVPVETRREIKSASFALATALGGVSVTNLEELYESVRSSDKRTNS